MSLLLLIGSCFWVWRASDKPLRWEETVTLANYAHQGEFDYNVYIEPGHLFGPAPYALPDVILGEEEEGPQYFTNIIESIDISFTYEFIPDYITGFTYSDVDIFAIIHGPSEWQKEVLLKSSSGGETCTVSFPLELETFDEIINDIEEELGVRSYTEVNEYDLVIEARVNVRTERDQEWLEDTFVQPMEISVGQDTLDWDNELDLVERRYLGEFSYKHVGNFGYTLLLNEGGTALYGTEVTEISSEPYEPPEIISRPAGEVYFPALIDIMKASFSYRFDCDQPVTNLMQEVTITAVLEHPAVNIPEEYTEVWEKTFTLVPKTEKMSEFVVYFPVDINYFANLIEIIREEIALGAPSNTITINAEVHTTANTEVGPIDEVFTHTLEGALTGTATLIWSTELEKTENGTIETTKIVTDPDLPAYRLWSRIVTGLLLLVVLFVVWHAIWAKPVMSKLKEEAFRAKKKHKNVIVDIKELPPAKPEETVVPISSLDELIAAADSLFKPVLHQAETDRHTYCVIDGLTRYEYISKR